MFEISSASEACRSCLTSENAKTTDPEALQKQLELGEHIKKGEWTWSTACLGLHPRWPLMVEYITDITEVLALISLKKFRHLRRSYHANEAPR